MKHVTDPSPTGLSDTNEDLQLLRDEMNFSDAEQCMTIVLQFLEQYYCTNYMTVITETLWSVHALTMPYSQSSQPTHWIRVPLPLLGKFLFEVLLISDSFFKIRDLRFPQSQKFILWVTLKMEAVCGTHLLNYMMPYPGRAHHQSRWQ
jgi:hypothetical protein